MSEMKIEVEGKVFTQSEISVWDACPYKWFLRYNLQKDLIGAISWPLIVGTEWHELMESLYKAKGKNANKLRCNVAKHIDKDVIITEEIEHDCEYWNEVLEATVQAYAEFYADNFKVFKIVDFEKILEVEIEVDGVIIRLAGKRDQKGYFAKSKLGIRDFKTTGQISKNYTEGWSFKFQFMFYLWLDYRCSALKDQATEFLVDVTKKTLLRWKDGENIITFAARVKADILQRPTEYFYLQSLDLTAKGVMEFEEKILMPKLRRIATLQKHPEMADILALSKNTDACNLYNQQCEYFANCYFGKEKQYKIREVKHTELETK
jgi:hypothetical protein